MSKFLAPIHFWVYEKIKIQEEMVDAVLALNARENWIDNLSGILDEEYGSALTGALEDIIDESNIHAWLQSEIDRVEKRLARALAEVINGDNSRAELLFDEIFQLGCKSAIGMESLKATHKIIMDRLIDGMPCDRIIKVDEISDDRIRWSRTVDVHSSYYDELDLDVEYYHRLRDEYINGFLVDSEVEYSSSDGAFEIRRM